jgi:DNA primase small subunit
MNHEYRYRKTALPTSSETSRSNEEESEEPMLEERDPGTQKFAQRFPRNGERMEYYSHFPLKEVFQFVNLNRGKDDDFPNRELSFCFPHPKGGVLWSRFRSFSSAAEFKDYVRRMQPLSINMGALGYSPAALWPLERTGNRRNGYYESELMLDVDIKDYDDVRSCNCTGTRVFNQFCPECGNATKASTRKVFERLCSCQWEKFSNNICLECWKFAQCGMMILDYILRKHWGLVDFFFVFSGMKGFHCWIMDDSFRSFDDEQRWEFSTTFDPWVTGQRIKLKCETKFEDPLYGDDFDEFLLLLFTEVIVGGGVFDLRHVNTRTRIVDYFDMRNVESESKLEGLMLVCDDCATKCYDSRKTWKALMDFNFHTNDQVTAKNIQKRFVYAYTYPRIDTKVTTQLNHPRKMPWSPHPRSECIALPILPICPERIFEFTPKTAPTFKDFNAIHSTTIQFATALDLMSVRLDDVLYCEEQFPKFPLMVELLELGDEARIFRQLDGWVVKNIHKEYLFYEYSYYAFHGRTCMSCNPLMVVERENTLLKLIVRMSWVSGVYKRVLEECLKLSLIKLCESFELIALPEALWERIQILQSK